MSSYTAVECSRDWRYAIEKDFTNSDGNPFSYAADGQQQWDDELHKISLKHSVRKACISDDGNRLALVQHNDIHVFDTKTWELVSVLKGHTSFIQSLAFQPGNSNLLVSGQHGDPGSDRQQVTAQCIIIWHLDRNDDVEAPTDEAVDRAIKDAVAATSKNLQGLGVDVTETDLQYMENSIAPHVRFSVSRHLAPRRTQIDGRLQSGSGAFSPTGAFIKYLPGEAPRTGNSDPWDICICDTETFQPRLILSGHTDYITWAGWNSDETLFGSMCLAGTIRIWDAATGEVLHELETGARNKTGAFSPDSKYFAATQGTGELRIYALDSLSPTSEHWCYKKEESKRWNGALDWHPNGKWLAVGSAAKGELSLLDVEQKTVLNERTLSYESCQVDEGKKRNFVEHFVGVIGVKFIDGGRKIVSFIYGDGSLEVYDIEDGVKWRFGRGGTDDGPRADKWRDDKGKVTTVAGANGLVWEDLEKGKVMLVSVDDKDVRIWSVERSSHNAA